MHEEEPQYLLKELSKIHASEVIKQNSEKYLKLLKIETNDNSDESVDGYKSGKPERMEKAKHAEKAGTNKLFIKRNIQLAKCGRGVLSLTDEEKLRLQTVLMDVEDLGENSGDTDFDGVDGKITKTAKMTENQYALNDETKKILEEIDRKLEKYDKMKFTSIGSVEKKAIEPGETAKKDDNGDGKEIKTQPRGFLKNEFKRLKRVDDLLNVLNSATYEEIDPLYDEDLQFLIEESKRSLSMAMRIDKSEHFDGNAINENSSISSDNQIPAAAQHTPSKEEMTELVSAAKNIMPNFKFRYKC